MTSVILNVVVGKDLIERSRLSGLVCLWAPFYLDHFGLEPLRKVVVAGAAF
jgi:hypothetical protein